MWVNGDLKGGLNMLITSEACWIRWSIVMSPGVVRAPTRREAFSERVLVLRMDHGWETKDGVSLARAGFEAVQICSNRSLISYYDSASCPNRCGCCLLGICFVRR